MIRYDSVHTRHNCHLFWQPVQVNSGEHKPGGHKAGYSHCWSEHEGKTGSAELLFPFALRSGHGTGRERWGMSWVLTPPASEPDKAIFYCCRPVADYYSLEHCDSQWGNCDISFPGQLTSGAIPYHGLEAVSWASPQWADLLNQGVPLYSHFSK